MLEHLFEYIAITILLILFGLFLVRHKIRDYFSIPMVQITQASLGIKVKNGYISLLKLLYHNSNKEGLEKEIRSISARRTDDRYIGGYTKDTYVFDSESFILDYFYEILNYTDAHNEEFIFSVSNYADIKKLQDKLNSLFMHLPKSIDFIIPSENKNLKEILLSYQKELLKYQIQMTFISDGSDTYYFIFYPISKEDEVSDAIEKIGLERLRLN